MSDVLTRPLPLMVNVPTPPPPSQRLMSPLAPALSEPPLMTYAPRPPPTCPTQKKPGTVSSPPVWVNVPLKTMGASQLSVVSEPPDML